MSSLQIKTIKQRLSRYKRSNDLRIKKRRERFLRLIEKHGVAKVAAAADLGEATINQYRRPSAAGTISDKLLIQLESILKEY